MSTGYLLSLIFLAVSVILVLSSEIMELTVEQKRHMEIGSIWAILVALFVLLFIISRKIP